MVFVHGFVHPASGRSLELHLPAASADRMAAALGEFTRWTDPEGGKPLVVLVDNAGRRVATRLEVPPTCSCAGRRRAPEAAANG